MRERMNAIATGGKRIEAGIDLDHWHRVQVARASQSLAGIPDDQRCADYLQRERQYPVKPVALPTALVWSALLAVMAGCGDGVATTSPIPETDDRACLVQYVSQVRDTDTTFSQVKHLRCPACLPADAQVIAYFNDIRLD